ncbi:MAG: hypothetical protein ACRDYX_01410 [Egibacteraceae bacterium]
MDHLIRPWERTLFKHCRRAWDFGARERQNYEPVKPTRVFDFDEAIHDALDVYYFPGMWDWGRAIVRPLAVEGFLKSMRRQRAAYAQHCDLSPIQEREWDEHVGLGREMLERYFLWAQEADRFAPVQVAAQFDVAIPDPRNPDDGLVTPDGRGIRYRVRIDLVVMDEHELYWLVEHRVVSSPWDDLDQLLIDEQSLSRSWSWELGFLAKIEGTIHNELRKDVPSGHTAPADAMNVQVLQGPSGLIKQQDNGLFRRTQIPRSEIEFEQHRVHTALEVLDMTDPQLLIYPNPTRENCSSCLYRQPCMAMSYGSDERPILEASYQKRTSEDFELGRLGSVWGFVPPIVRVAEWNAPGGEPAPGGG